MERSVSLQAARVCARRTVTAHDIRTAETCLWRSLPWIGERLAPRCACEHSTRAAHVRCASCWCLRVNLVSPAFFWSSVVRVALSHGSSLSAVATCSSYPLISLRAVVFMYTYIHIRDWLYTFSMYAKFRSGRPVSWTAWTCSRGSASRWTRPWPRQ